jgi:hypothetical protein
MKKKNHPVTPLESFLTTLWFYEQMRLQRPWRKRSSQQKQVGIIKHEGKENDPLWK